MIKNKSEKNSANIDENVELEKLTKILLREIKERENQLNKSELKKAIKNRVLGGDEDAN